MKGLMMKSPFACLVVLAAAALMLGTHPAGAQAFETASTPLSLNLEAGFSAIHANAPPNGGCGCFYFYGFNGQVEVASAGHLSYVFDYNHGRAGNIGGKSLDHNIVLSTYTGGVRYNQHLKGLKVFGEALAGIAHTDSTYLLESNASNLGVLGGGGVDLPLGSHFDLRLAEVDFLYTRTPNGTNDHQNEIRYNAGVVYHFTKK